MIIARRPSELIVDDAFLELEGFLPGVRVLAKLESLHAAGSIKIKTALSLLDACERSGALKPGGTVIESSSGNLGIALALVCSERRYHFIAVCDPNVLPGSLRMMRSLGARVEMVVPADRNGYLQARLEHIRGRLASDPTLVWTNQYANQANARAHRDGTAAAVLSHVPELTHLFVGAGTCGTLAGVLDRIESDAPQVQVFGVDVEGSVLFGGPARPRFIPGIGSSREAQLLTPEREFHKVVVDEATTVRMSRELIARWSFLAGGSTGSVLAAVRKCGPSIPQGATVVAISPDGGERYLETLYDDDWVQSRFPGLLLAAEERES